MTKNARFKVVVDRFQKLDFFLVIHLGVRECIVEGVIFFGFSEFSRYYVHYMDDTSCVSSNKQDITLP